MNESIARQRTADQLIPELARYEQRFLVAGGAAGVLSLAGLLIDPRQFFQSYLIAYTLVLGATLGCLAVGMIHQLSGGAWGVVTRRIFGAATRVLPVLTLLFLPIVFGMTHLYEWTRADVVAADPVLQHKQPYLNTPFFVARAALYFLVWNGLTYFLNAWSLEQDKTADPAVADRMRRLSAGGLVAYGLTVTFASFDWLMSLDAHWFSTIYGVLVIGGQGLTALAFVIVALVWLSRRPPLDTIVEPGHLHDLANLMLAFVMLWAYFSFSQYLIIYSGNLPEEITWYIRRLHTGWRSLGLALVLFHFAVPFLILLSRRVKRQPDLIVKVACGVLFMRFFDLFWLIAPEFHREGFAVSWLDVMLPLSLGLVWMGCFVHQFRGRTILPIHDPEFGETLGPILDRPAKSHGTGH